MTSGIKRRKKIPNFRREKVETYRNIIIFYSYFDLIYTFIFF